MSSIEIEELEREIKTHELENIIALGGISLVNVDKLLGIGLMGVALLGDIWNQTEENFIPHFRELKETIL